MTGAILDAAALRLDGLRPRRGGRPIVDPVDLQARGGEVIALLGPNGAGKSSLLAAIAMTGIAADGRALVGHEPVAAVGARARARLVAMLAQDASAPAELLVRQLVEVGAVAGGADRPSSAADAAMAAMRLAGLADRRIGTLSGGQRQLAQLARVIAQDAPVVLLDEPTTALDPGHRAAVADAILRLAADGRVVVAATHDLDLAMHVADRVLLLDRRGGHRLGPTDRILTPDAVLAVFGVRTSVHRTDDGRTHLLPVGERRPSESPD